MFMDNGWLEPLNGYYEGDTEYDIDDFYEASKELTIREDQLYAIPLMTERQVVYYNKELFEEAEITELPKTLEEFEETAAKLHDPDRGVSGIVIRERGQMRLRWYRAFFGITAVNLLQTAMHPSTHRKRYRGSNIMEIY